MNALSLAKMLRAVTCPEYSVRQLIKRLSIGSLDFRLAVGALDRAEYAFGVQGAVYLASKLGHKDVSVIEFGVAEGAGLLTLERYASEFGRRAGVEVEVYGFDTGVGLPDPVPDYRDLPYVWKKGAYQMDVPKLKAKLRSARLILGNVEETIPRFLTTDHAPIGFISFDLDYYSATAAAFRIFAECDSGLLPRVICYFDDIVSDEHQFHCDRVGELLAIRTFNESAGPCQTIAPIYPLRTNVVFPAQWMQQLWAYHRFNHPDYNTYIGQ